MTTLFNTDDNWEDDPPVRLAQPPVAWLGSACVWGPAQSQGSKTAFIHPHAKRPNGSPVVVVTDSNDKALKSWRQELVDAMVRTKPDSPLNTAVAVSVIVYVPRPMAHYRTGEHAGELKANAAKVPAAGRDIDKVARAILDAGQIARWWTNDARVTDLRMRRRYDDGIGERTWVWAWQVSESDQPSPELPEVIDVGEDE
jgi:Holliday junction resolvase RusA-like endonuclease